MERTVKRLILALGIVLLFALSPAQGQLTPTVSFMATEDGTSPTGVYIPKDVDDSFKELEKMMPPAMVSEMKAKDEKDLSRYDITLGRWLRKNWQLWGESKMAQYFRKMGIFHPDDMSTIVIVSFWRHLNEKPINLEEQVESCKAYWEKMAPRKPGASR